MNKLISILILALIIGIGVITRFIDDIPNFNPILAVALFSGFVFNNKIYGLLLPLGIMLLSDYFLGFYPEVWSVYLVIMVSYFLGSLYKKFDSIGLKLVGVFGLSLVSATIHFLITNFAVWLTVYLDLSESTMMHYSKDLAGLLNCYQMAIPFFKPVIVSTVLFAFIGFGANEALARSSEVVVNENL